MKKKKWLAIVLSVVLILAIPGCGEKDSLKDTEIKDNEMTQTDDSDVSEDDMFTNRDLNSDYNVNESVYVSLNGDSVSCDSDSVKIDRTRITLSEEATYIFSGKLDNGQIIVNAGEQDKLQMVLDGAEITSESSAALYVLEADKVVVTLAADSENVLANGGSFEAIDENNIDGAVFSKQDLTFNGTGSLTVTSPADHGIVCKDDLVFVSGSYVIESASHGIDANDSVRIAEASMKVTAGKDGIRAENDEDTEKGFVYVENGSFDISAEGDGISASNYLQIQDGAFTILTGGGSENAEQKTSEGWGGFPGGMGGMDPGRGGRSSSSDGAAKMSFGTSVSSDTSSETDDSSTSIKGLKASGDLLIEGGSFTIDSADDAVHSNACITVNAGTFAIETGDDGFHADDTLTIAGGSIDIKECYEGFEGLHVKVTGGDSKIVSSDDGLNAAGGTDSSGTGGMRGGDQFGGHGGMGGPGGGMSANSDGSIVISGGKLYVNASGDGIDANGYLEIKGGYTVVVGPTRGDTATLDYDTTATISGGTFIGTGASGMAQTFSDSEQGVFSVQVGNCPAGTEFSLTDSEGNVVVEYAPELDYAVIILSSEEMVKGEMYTISIGESSAEFEAR